MKRMKTLLCLVILISLGCSQNNRQDVVKSDSVARTAVNSKPAESADIEQSKTKRAKEWLLSGIEQFFRTDLGQENDTSIFTKQYLQYKQDAIGREFDGLTEKQFADKWRSKYNTKFATTGSLLIGQQDTVDPKVTRCELKRENPDGSFVFHVVLEDSDADGKYVHVRDMKVIPSGNKFLIDDILEYD